jgi:cytoskeletal protein RodZ
MQTVGDILKQARIKKKLTLSQLSQQTKISKTILKALEKNRFSQLPSATYIKGFIKNYSQALALDPDRTIAVFRRDFHQTKAGKIIPRALTKPLNQSTLQLTPRLSNITALAVFFLLLLGYLGFSLWQLYQPPKLFIAIPTEGQEVSSPVLVKGKIDHDAVLLLDGKTVNLEPDGSFTTVYNAPPGAATLHFKATSRRSRITELKRHIIIVKD